MHIVMITGSPHRHGTSALLAEAFLRGAQEAGHTVFRFDTAFECVHPCIGCERCACGANPCVFQDAMNELYRELPGADMVVFVSPLYYHAMSSQIKMAIDRFHGIDNALRGSGKKAMLLMTAADKEEHIFRGAAGSYHKTVRYLGWQDCGMLLCGGCYTREDIEKTDYPQKAYALGRAIQ